MAKEKEITVVLKLGGSVVTDKNKPFTISPDLPRIAHEIKQSGAKRLVIIHGGGSFGHPLASKYKIQQGKKTQGQILGFAKTQKAMEDLNNHVLCALLKAGIPAFPLQPSSMAEMESGKIKRIAMWPIKRALKDGLVPVLYGVPAFDSKNGFCILSGDELVHVIARKLKADRVLLASDVDGVMTADPKSHSAKLVKTVTEKNFNKLQLTLSKVTDVTGGMLRKVQELLGLARSGIESEIMNAKVPGNLLKALKGEKIGTTVK